MTVLLIIGLGLIFTLGIFFMSSNMSGKKKTREECLKELTDYLEGRMEPIEDRENSYRITFMFEGVKYVLEDIEQVGFGKKDFQAFLKARTHSHINMVFVEKEEKTTVRSDILIASQIPDEPIKENLQVKMPKGFERFDVRTNNPVEVNQLLADARIVRVLRKFRNEDTRGFVFMSLKVMDGVVIVEFQSGRATFPSFTSLVNDIPSIEGILTNVDVLVKTLNRRTD